MRGLKERDFQQLAHAGKIPNFIFLLWIFQERFILFIYPSECQTPIYVSSVMFVWDQKIRQFPVKDPTFRAFHPADDTDMTFMPFLQQDPFAGIPVGEFFHTDWTVGYGAAFN